VDHKTHVSSCFKIKDNQMNAIYRGAMAAFALGLMGSSALSSPAIQIETIYSFNSGGNGTLPEYPGGLIVDEKGTLYGETSEPAVYIVSNPAPTRGGSVFRLNPPTKGQPSWTKTILHNFTGSPDGTGDVAIAYSHGKIYGVTDFGGDNSSGVTIPPGGTGIAFSLNGQTENILYTFCKDKGAGCTDGSLSSLVAGDQGVIYGINPGSLFMLTSPRGKQSAWTESTIYSQVGLFFGVSQLTFGSSCCSSLLIENDAIYVVGTVVATNQNILLKFTPPTKGQPSWTKTIIYTFVDIGTPSLISDHQGGFYGTTFGSGVYNNGPFGTVFQLTPPSKGQSVWTNTVLYNFKGGSDDGSGPIQLVIDGKGSLYGITNYGGNRIGLPGRSSPYVRDAGTLFKLSPPANGHTIWSETVYKFCPGPLELLSTCIDGAVPNSLVADKGTIYGSTSYRGTFGTGFFTGTIFKVTSP
jgi:hypothetical protein